MNKQIKDMVIEDDNKRRGEIYNDVMKQMREAQHMQNEQQQLMNGHVVDETEPDMIALEMSNIMKEINMTELNDLGYDIGKNELIEVNEQVDITDDIKTESSDTVNNNVEPENDDDITESS